MVSYMKSCILQSWDEEAVSKADLTAFLLQKKRKNSADEAPLKLKDAMKSACVPGTLPKRLPCVHVTPQGSRLCSKPKQNHGYKSNCSRIKSKSLW